MLEMQNVIETVSMKRRQLRYSTITMGISLVDCGWNIIVRVKIYNKIYNSAKDLVKTGELIEGKFGIPIVNKRIAVISLNACLRWYPKYARC